MECAIGGELALAYQFVVSLVLTVDFHVKMAASIKCDIVLRCQCSYCKIAWSNAATLQHNNWCFCSASPCKYCSIAYSVLSWGEICAGMVFVLTVSAIQYQCATFYACGAPMSARSANAPITFTLFYNVRLANAA